MRNDANYIIQEAIKKVLPDEAIKQALKHKQFDNGDLYVVAIGKAAWQMAKTASSLLKDRIKEGIVITKYDHVKGILPHIHCFEAGHPIVDENTLKATQEVLKMVKDLKKEDTVLFLVSGGGSALFEDPYISLEELQDINKQLLACGASIQEINTIRKRLSKVKGGRFGKLCYPAHVYSVVLSDVIGDPLDIIASGPAYPDSTTKEDALTIVHKYKLNFSENVLNLLQQETPKELSHVETMITGSVNNLCLAAYQACLDLGYHPTILTTTLTTQAKDAGKMLGDIAIKHQNTTKSLAFIAGGETVVYLTGKGKGGRNQELALSGADSISGLKDTCLFSVGSDGTDGPTDAAGGYVDSYTKEKLLTKGILIDDVLKENNAYPTLKLVDGLIMTGPTGTNVNDVSIVLIKR